MDSKGYLSEEARLQAENATESARPWMERLARLRYATEGALYALIGLLAAGAAVSRRRREGHGPARCIGGSCNKPFRRRLAGVSRARIPGLRRLAGRSGDCGSRWGGHRPEGARQADRVRRERFDLCGPCL